MMQPEVQPRRSSKAAGFQRRNGKAETLNSALLTAAAQPVPISVRR